MSRAALFRRRWTLANAGVAGPSFVAYWTLRAATYEAGRRNTRLVKLGMAPSWRVVPA